MTRRKFDEDDDKQERWLLSYADFITLLFAFFVVMYAISSVNEGKYRQLSTSLGDVFGAANQSVQPGQPESIKFVAPINGLNTQNGPNRQRASAIRRERESMTAMARDLQKALAHLVSEGKVKVSQNSRGVSVEINASVLFAPAEAALSQTSDQALRVVASLLRDDPHAIQVEGHTDNVPISTAIFASNWELSSARASSVVRLFVEQGIAASRLTAVGHASNKPVADNAESEGRARNRRVEITIITALPDPSIDIPTSPSPAPTNAAPA
ncbi:MAG: flagellar motor protein MotD [Burkholderiales bacterium]|nr:flagellar motor protein MotD [Burkholderiales bacterium]